MVCLKRPSEAWYESTLSQPFNSTQPPSLEGCSCFEICVELLQGYLVFKAEAIAEVWKTAAHRMTTRSWLLKSVSIDP